MSTSTPSTEASTSEETNSRLVARAGSAAVFIEKYVLPFVYFFMAWRELASIYQLSASMAPTVEGASLHFAASLRHLLLFLLQLFVAIMLLLNQKPLRQPANLKEIVIPFIGSFFFLAYSLLIYFPLPWRRILTPITWQANLTFIALLLAIGGYAVSTWGVMCLGRSFALIVSVREVVFRGPYRYLRHPIYFGYSCAIFGLALSNLCAAMVVLVALHFLLFVYRGRLEERRLAEFSPAYRDYMTSTGFIFPRFRAAPANR